MNLHDWRSSDFESEQIQIPAKRTPKFHQARLHHVPARADCGPSRQCLWFHQARRSAFQKRPWSSAENTHLVYFWRKPRQSTQKKSDTGTVQRIRSIFNMTLCVDYRQSTLCDTMCRLSAITSKQTKINDLTLYPTYPAWQKHKKSYFMFCAKWQMLAC